MNEVVIGAPYSVTKELMNHFKVDVVCHGQTPIALDSGTQDPYAVPKMMKKFVLIDSGKLNKTRKRKLWKFIQLHFSLQFLQAIQ